MGTGPAQALTSPTSYLEPETFLLLESREVPDTPVTGPGEMLLVLDENTGLGL